MKKKLILYLEFGYMKILSRFLEGGGQKSSLSKKETKFPDFFLNNLLSEDFRDSLFKSGSKIS